MIDYTGTIWVNGKWLDASKPAISIFDHGLLYGDGVFDTMFAMDGRVFKLDAHLNRLWNSLHAVDLVIPFSRDQIRSVTLETIARNGLRDAYVKLIATRGLTPQPLLNPVGNVPTAIVFARPYMHLSGSADGQKPLSAKIVTVKRTGHESIDPRIKTLNYLNHILAQVEATRSACDAALMTDSSGEVCEGAGYNIFAVRDGCLRTPGQGILEGVTRTTVIELAEEIGIAVEIGSLRSFDLYTAQEVFLSSTAGGLMPIATVDGRTIRGGAPGPVFKRIFNAYKDCISSGRHGTSIPSFSLSASESV